MISTAIIFIFGFRAVTSDCLNPNCRGVHLSPVQDYDLNRNVSEECRDNQCLILDVITLLPTAWTVFCMDDEKILYAYWDCNRNSSLVNRRVKFRCFLTNQCGSPIECDPKKYVEPCSCAYDSYFCEPKRFSSEGSSSGTTASDTTDLETTSSSPTSLETEETEIPATTTDIPAEPNATFSCETGPCFAEECFFEHHCYFFRESDIFDFRANAGERFSYEPVTKEICAEAHPSALGVAVETKEENEFVKELVRQRNLRLGENRRVLTSGIKRQKAPGEWRGWNSELNETVLDLETSPSSSLEYVALKENSGVFSWYYEPPTSNESPTGALVLCERLYEDFIVWPDRQEECAKMSKGKTRSGRDHCCGVDESGTVWFGSPKSWTVKSCREIDSEDVRNKHLHHLAMWFCDENGRFATEFPRDPGCLCRKCVKDYDGFRYISCYNRTGLGECPSGTKGYSKRFCGEKEDPPDFGTCCIEKETPCRDVDPFLNVWVSCPSKTAEKNTRCPEGAFYDTATVAWRCGENGLFENESPDYAACYYCPLGRCRGTDKYLREWKACVGETAEKDCPEGFTGTAFWECGTGGKFVNSEPDFSLCRPPWIDQVQNEIEAGNDSVWIMDSIGNHTKKDSETGFGDIVRIASLCVDLFEIQSSLDDTFDTLDRFAVSYSNFLENVLTNATVWSDFTLDKRLNYSREIVETTERVAFSKLNRKNDQASILEDFNRTFKNLDESGLGFFVTYGRKPEGALFLARNSKDWFVEIKTVRQDLGNNFAAVGLVLGYNVGVLMFPNGNGTLSKKISAPIVTFSVASKIKGSVQKVTNVTVKIGFKHFRKARHPPEILVRRRLHEGETPSEVYGSSLCYYYSVPVWDREGCRTDESDAYETNCSCTHLSTISVLMDLHEYVPEPGVELVSMICSGISIVALLLTLTVFFGFESIKSERTTIGKHLCSCLLIGHVMLLTVMDKKFFYLNDDACSAVAVVLHYVFTAAFLWMSIEGHHLYRLVVLVFESDTDYKVRYLLVGYGGPVFVVGLTQLTATIYGDRAYGQDELCWLQTPDYAWAFVGPVTGITTFNLLVLTVAMRLAVVAKSGDGKSNAKSVKLWLKGWFSLSTLLGVTWLVGLGYIQYNYFFVYGFVVLNGLQGLFIFLFRCVLNDQVRGTLARQYGNRSSPSEDSRTIQRTRMRKETSGSRSGFVATLSETRKSSRTSSTDFLVENESVVSDRDRTAEKEGIHRCERKPLPFKQILQKIQSQSKRESERFESERSPQDRDPPSYSECVSPQTYASEQGFPSFSSDGFLFRYPTIEEEPDSFDSGRSNP